MHAGLEAVGKTGHRGPLLGFRIPLHALLFAAQARHLDGVLPEHVHRLRHPADFVAALAIRQLDLVRALGSLRIASVMIRIGRVMLPDIHQPRDACDQDRERCDAAIAISRASFTEET